MAAPVVPFKRRLSTGAQGSDVAGVGRALARAGYLGTFSSWMAALPGVKSTWGSGKTAAVKKLQRDHGRRQTGAYGPAEHDILRRTRKAGSATEWAFDGKAIADVKAYTPPTVLVEPKQGFSSLAHELWEAYSIGRHMGLTDLGTYNPSSTLPGGGPSDHSVYPAFAFDLGCSPQTGWANTTARAFFNKMVGRPEVHYVILGDRIWTRESGLHAYTAGNHDNHVHVSGVH